MSVEAGSVSSFTGISRGGSAGKGAKIVIWPNCANGLRRLGIAGLLIFRPAKRAARPPRDGSLLIVLDLLAIGEAGIAQSRPDGKYSPSLHLFQVWHFAQALHDGVVVHHDRRLLIIDLRDQGM